MIGLDPRPFTMMQLVWMAEGRIMTSTYVGQGATSAGAGEEPTMSWDAFVKDYATKFPEHRGTNG